MNNLEDNLKKIKIKNISDEDKSSLWHRIQVGHLEMDARKQPNFGFSFWHLKTASLGLLAMLVFLAGGGVVTASSQSLPGSTFFPVKLAMEKAQIRMSGVERKEELRFHFAEDRIVEIKTVVEKNNQSDQAIEDLGLSEKQTKEISLALTQVDSFVNKDDSSDKSNKEELKKSLHEVLILLEEKEKAEIKKENGRIRIENKKGEIKIEVKNKEKSTDGFSQPEGKSIDSIQQGIPTSNGAESTTDVKENASEVFCRGEWRDPQDCERSSDDENIIEIEDTDSDSGDDKQDEFDEDNSRDADSSDDSNSDRIENNDN